MTAERHGHPQGSGCEYAAAEPDEMQLKLQRRMASIHHTVMVLSGKGGVGKSTVAANLAVALAERGRRVGLLDVDVHGPSIPKLLHLEDRRPEPSPEQGIMPVEFDLGIEVMSLGFFLPHADEAVIWRGPRKYSAIEQLLAETEWGELDVLVVDAPPGTGDEPLAVAQLIPGADGAVVVTTPQDLAVVDVRKSITFCRALDLPVLGVIENMSGLRCPHCGELVEVFATRGGGETLARDMGVPFLGRIPIDPAVSISGDAGRPYLLSASDTAVAEAFRAAVAPLLELDARPEAVPTS